jgi:hypothetical protein
MYIALYIWHSFELVHNVGGTTFSWKNHRIVDCVMHAFKGGIYVAQNLLVSIYIEILHTFFMVYNIGLHK